MLQDPHKAEEATETPAPSKPKPKSRPRFRIEKLEERIAPFHNGCFYYREEMRHTRGRCP